MTRGYFVLEMKGLLHRQQNNKINQATVVAENSVGIPH